MASLFIKDAQTADSVTRLAKRLGTSKTETVRQAIRALEDTLPPERSKEDFVEWLVRYRREHPLPPPTGLKADKAFFDWLSGEEDVDDAVR